MPLPMPTSREAIAAIQSERKVIAVERARRAPFHKGRLDHIDTTRLDDPAEWAKIPIMDKEQLRAIPPESYYDHFCIAPREEVAELWRSGGSSGVPLFYPRTFEDLRYALLSFARAFDCAGARAGEWAHISFPLGIHPVGHAYARAAQQCGIGVNWAGSGASTPSALQIELIDRLRPDIWMGMSSYGIHLANIAEAREVDLAGGPVRLIMTSAEPISAAKREKMERMWGARLQDNFGMTEAGLMGSESEAADGFHIWTDMYFIEVVDETSGEPVAEGQPGLLVVTPLWTNNATPFIRWNSGDVVVYQQQGAAGGAFSIFPIIRHAHRTVGFFKIRGVSVNHPDLEDFMFRLPDVADFKAEALTRDGIDLLLLSIEVGRNDQGEAVARRIATEFKNVFELTPEITILERGTLATEFESNIKAPRFQERREE
ncbi:MAG: AMP-binding protein [bacterium]